MHQTNNDHSTRLDAIAPIQGAGDESRTRCVDRGIVAFQSNAGAQHSLSPYERRVVRR